MLSLAHGFLGRRGGVSTGPYESLNLAYWVGDERAHVDENWRRLREVIGAETKVARHHQVARQRSPHRHAPKTLIGEA